jgi:hypothetical protein
MNEQPQPYDRNEVLAANMEHGAVVRVFQMPNGYWAAHMFMRIPGLPDQGFGGGENFHAAGEAIEWARTTIETVEAGQLPALPLPR